MSSITHKLSLPWVASLAILGLALFGQGTAEACGTNQAQATRACCSTGPSAGCGGCCDPVEDRTSDQVAPAAGDVHLVELANASVPARSCECRSQTPAAPTSKHESEEHTQRANDLVAESLAVAVRVPPSKRSSYGLDRLSSSPRTPLYLRVSRLLI